MFLVQISTLLLIKAAASSTMCLMSDRTRSLCFSNPVFPEWMTPVFQSRSANRSEGDKIYIPCAVSRPVSGVVPRKRGGSLTAYRILSSKG